MISNKLRGKYSNYHYCIVRECKNTSIKAPEKLWIRVPSEINMRNTWLNLAKRDPSSLSTETILYLCEDHFDLECDMENYMQYKLMGSVKKIQMKPHCIPSKFQCQTVRKLKVMPTPNKLQHALKTRAITPILGDNKQVYPINISSSLLNQELLTDAVSSYYSSSSHESNEKAVPVIQHNVPFCDPAAQATIPKITIVKTELEMELPGPKLQQCSWCNDTIYGYVFVCVQCDVRVCAECETCDTRGHDSQHYVLRAPSDSPQSELELVINNIREALSSTGLLLRTNLPKNVPDIDSRTNDVPNDDRESPGVPEHEVVKMEFKAEEEEYQQTEIDPLCTLVENQPSPCDAYGVAEGTSYITPYEEEPDSTASSVTRTSRSSSLDLSSSDSEEMVSAPSYTERRKINWTDHMNRYLIQTYMTITKSETRKSRVYLRLKQAFALAFPHIRVTKSQLQEQRKLILREQLLDVRDLLKIQNGLPSVSFSNNVNRVAKELSLNTVKGQRLELTKVTSGVQNEITDQSRLDWMKSEGPQLKLVYPRINQCTHVDKKPAQKQCSDMKIKYRRISNPVIPQRDQSSTNVESLLTARSGRQRKVPGRLLSKALRGGFASKRTLLFF